MLKYKLYLMDLKRAIENAESSIKGKEFSSFSKNKDCIDANAMRIQIIGESLKNLPKSFWTKSKQDVNALIDFRNIISHAYFKVDPALL